MCPVWTTPLEFLEDASCFALASLGSPKLAARVRLDLDGGIKPADGEVFEMRQPRLEKTRASSQQFLVDADESLDGEDFVVAHHPVAPDHFIEREGDVILGELRIHPPPDRQESATNQCQNFQPQDRCTNEAGARTRRN